MRRLAIFALFSMAGCGGDASLVGQIVSGQVIGSNDMKPVLMDGANIPAKYRPLIDGFGRVKTHLEYCSGTHLGDGIVITAGHCFGAGAQRQNDLDCPKTIVEWGWRQDKDAYLTSQCTKVLAQQRDGEFDYAIFKVDPPPPVTIPIDLKTKPASGAKLTMFGFPNAKPEEWSPPDLLDSGSGATFHHKVDSEAGNSGSSLLLDDSLVVIGIHDGAVTGQGVNYGTYLSETPLKEFISADGFSASLSPLKQKLPAGAAVTFVVTTTAEGAPQPLTLTLVGLPNGLKGAFDPAQLMSGASSTLTLQADANAALGDASFEVAVSGATTKMLGGAVTVVAPAPPDDMGPVDMAPPVESPDAGIPDAGGTGGGGEEPGGGCSLAPHAASGAVPLVLWLAGLLGLAGRRRRAAGG